MHVEVGGLWHFEFHVELRVAAGGSVEFDMSVAAADINIHVRFFHAAFAARLDGVVQADLVRLAALDVQVAHAEADVQHAASDKVPDFIVRFFVVPVVRSGTKGNQQETGDDCFVEPRQIDAISSIHEAPLRRTSACLWYERSRTAVPGKTELQINARSEEHTSELQSPDHLVCRLL